MDRKIITEWLWNSLIICLMDSNDLDAFEFGYSGPHIDVLISCDGVALELMVNDEHVMLSDCEWKISLSDPKASTKLKRRIKRCYNISCDDGCKYFG